MFTWGEHDATQFTDTVNTAYAEAVHCKMNLFKVPYGKAGKSFVSELARLFKAFATSSALESVHLKAATLMPILLLQKPPCKSKAKDHITYIPGMMTRNLARGGPASPPIKKEKISRSFPNLMFQGKTKAALCLLSEQSKGARVLHLDDPIETENGQRKVRDILLCTELVDPATIAPLMASRLIALDKNPGVCPIGIGDTARRIIAKATHKTRHTRNSRLYAALCRSDFRY